MKYHCITMKPIMLHKSTLSLFQSITSSLKWNHLKEKQWNDWWHNYTVIYLKCGWTTVRYSNLKACIVKQWWLHSTMISHILRYYTLMIIVKYHCIPNLTIISNHRLWDHCVTCMIQIYPLRQSLAVPRYGIIPLSKTTNLNPALPNSLC